MDPELKAHLTAFARDCVANGDMTPGGGQALLHLLEEHDRPVPEPCRACGGRGTWEVECCNGSSGCPCRGGLVDMGSCRACGGAGVVEQQRPMANANFILDNHIGYPGGGPRW